MVLFAWCLVMLVWFLFVVFVFVGYGGLDLVVSYV